MAAAIYSIITLVLIAFAIETVIEYNNKDRINNHQLILDISIVITTAVVLLIELVDQV